jgi:hypothetical protein
VRFEKQKTYKDLAETSIRYAAYVSILIFVFISPLTYWSYSHPSQNVPNWNTAFGFPVDISNPITFVWAAIGVTPWVFIGTILLIFIPTLYSSSNIPAIRNFYLKGRRASYPECTLEISNPSEEINYTTRNLDPLIDMSYSKDIADALISASIVKIEITEKDKSKKHAHVLCMKFSRPAIGKLKIVEY